MAMRGPRSGDVRPRIVVRPVYEDFKPMFEWKQEQSSDLLIVYLPGFMKEYLKVTIEGRNIVRVRGERLVAGNKWSRFQEDYQIPEHCNATGIRAKFERGILTVTMPRKNNVVPQVQVVPPKIEPKKEAITTPIPEKNITTQVEKGEISNTKGTTTSQEFEQIQPQDATNKEKSPPIKKEELISEPKVNHKNVTSQEKSPPINKEELISEPKVNDKNVTNQEKFPPINKEEFISEPKVNHKNVTNDEKSSRDAIKKEEPISEPKGFHEELSPRVVEKRTGLKNGEILEGKLKEKNRNISDNKDLGESKLDYIYKKVVMRNKEEEQLLVNMGVAVLVIVALGAYVYYTQG